MKDRELIEFAAEFRKGIIGDKPGDLFCFAICSPMVPLLNLNGVDCEMDSADGISFGEKTVNHYWIKLADGRVLDPTADQFDRHNPRVYLGAPCWFHYAPEAKEETML